MSDKLLHEKMRELAVRCTFTELASITLTNGEKVTCLYRNELTGLADEIERYYIPRPRFEDGEPVQSSDMEEIGALATCCVYTDGSWVFEPDKYEDEMNPKPWDRQSGTRNDRIKRPAPKLLDADGVPIEVGDTVWCLTNGGKKGLVSAFVSKDTVEVVWADDGSRTNGVAAKNLTHREPDTLEKLRDDMRRTMTESPDARFMDSSWVDRLTALIERGA